MNCKSGQVYQLLEITTCLGAEKRLIPENCCRFRRLLYCVVVVFLLGLMILYAWVQPSDRISAYDPKRGERNIIFVETTCAVQNEPWSGLSARQACAVESAARHHPGWHIYLLHTCAPPPNGLWMPGGASAVHMPLDAFLWDTPLYTPLLWKGALAASHWPVEHASDVMRLVALWKYGGIYLDLDFVILRELTQLGEDWAVAEDSSLLANCALSMSVKPGTAGPEVAEACMQLLRDDFDGAVWIHNGPQVITRVLRQRCHTNSTAAMTNCTGFHVLPGTLFFPVHYSSWQSYFSEEDANATLAKMEKAYGVHVWNKLSRINNKTLPNSAYARIARANCPDSYGGALYDF